MNRRLGICTGSLFLLTALTLGMIAGFVGSVPRLLDDHFLYERFIETLAHGKLDLSIYGFHGSDFFAVPLYWLTGSHIVNIQYQMLWALTLPTLAFFAGRAVYKQEWEAQMFACIIALMPFLSFVCLRGWTGPAYAGLMLLCIALARRVPVTAGLALGLAILTKPFAIALLPLFLWLTREQPRQRQRWGVAVMLGIVLLYVIAQYLQIGHLLVGAHADVDARTVWQGPVRIIANAAHALQILFSVHNYYFPDPALTGPGNLMHTTPVLIFLGLFGLLAPKKYFADVRLPFALLLGACIGIGLNLPLDHMDHFYMQASILLLILAALPVLRAHPLWLPLVLATLHFQWFYFYLQYKETFHLGYQFFTLPLLADVLAVLWCVLHGRTILLMLKEAGFSPSSWSQ